MKKLLFLLLLCLVVPSYSYKYMNLIINHSKVSETASSFLYSFDLSDSIVKIDANIDSAKHVIVCVTPGDTTTKYPRYVHYIEGKRFLLYVAAPKDAVTDDTLQVCFGTEFSAVNATATYTNNNIPNFWGMDRFSGNTFYDYAGSNNGTGTSVDTGAGSFGVGAEFNANTDQIDVGQISALKSSEKITILLTAKCGDWDGSNSYNIFRCVTDANNRVHIYVNSGIMYIAVGNGSNSFGTFPITLLTNGKVTHLGIVYNGTQTGNSNRLKMYIDGVSTTLTFTGTIPATTPSLAGVVLTIGHTTNTSMVGNFDEFSITSDAKSAGYALDRYRMLFDTTFYSVGAMTSLRLRLDSVGVSQFIIRGTFPTVDSVVILAKATINGANGDSLLLTAASPLMWRQAAYPITLYSSGTAYGFNYYYRKMGIIPSYLLNLGVGF